MLLHLESEIWGQYNAKLRHVWKELQSGSDCRQIKYP